MNPANRPSINASDVESLLARHAELIHKIAALPGVYTASWSTDAAAAVCSALAVPWCAWAALRDHVEGTVESTCIAVGAAVDPSSSAPISHSDLIITMSSSVTHQQIARAARTLEGTPGHNDGDGVCTFGPSAVPAALAWNVQGQAGSDTPRMRTYLLTARQEGDEVHMLAYLLRTAARSIARRMVLMGTLNLSEPPVPITRREHEVLVKLVEGQSVHQAAESLGISPMTAHDFVKSLHRKLGVTTRAALVARYFAR